jgi:Na+/H+ antiporter NhaD/arsenite permease-like protein
MMETVEYFSDFLRKIGAPNFLAIGIVIIVIWLLISGFRKGLKRRGGNKESQKDEKNKNEDPSE